MLLHFLLLNLFLFSEGCYCETNVKKKNTSYFESVSSLCPRFSLLAWTIDRNETSAAEMPGSIKGM